MQTRRQELSDQTIEAGRRLLLRDEMKTHNTQTEEKIRREKIIGKEKANQTHKEVGSKVRRTIKELGGTMPENLPAAEDIKIIQTKQRRELKGQ